MVYLSIYLSIPYFLELFIMNFVYRFPAVRGIQAEKEYYISMVPLKMLPKLFPDNEEYVPPEYRAQRKLNESRVPVISRYILSNRNNYVFSALAASIDGEFSFVSTGNDSTGMLEVDMSSRFLLNDGQHRKAAIMDALGEDPSLGDETISIVFFRDKGLEKSQQIFTDLNKNAVKTSKSISELYDSRDELAVLTRKTIAQIPFLNEYTDKEKDILGKYSSNLFTLNTFYIANHNILEKKSCDDKDREFLYKYWNEVTASMLPWQELAKKEITKVDLRENYIATQGVVVQALGKIGRYFYTHSDEEFHRYISKLGIVNWRRSNPEWKQRAIKANGRIITNKKAVMYISNEVKNTLGIELSPQERQEEAQLLELRKKETT